MSPVHRPSGDPFDMRSNLELYTGERSASLAAVELALREAGVGPGEPVHVFGHSQGAMLASALALEGTYDVQTLVTYGSPVEAAVPESVLSVGIRHVDDPVAGLAGGGHAETVGAPGSFIAERVADPAGGVHDLTLAAHGIERYAETAAMVDASHDPRAAALRELWTTLGAAERVEVTEYAADRGGGWPAQSLLRRGRRRMPMSQLMTEISRAATTPHQKSSTRRPQSHHCVNHAVSHSRKPLITSEIRPSVRM